MKNPIFIIFISAFLFSNILFCQDMHLPHPDSDYVQLLGMSSTDLKNLTNNKTNDKVDGSPYLFDNWSNVAKVFYYDKQYNFKSFNYNIYASRFEAKISSDSVFVINPVNVNKVSVNDRIFSHYKDPESLKIGYYEELIDFDSYRVLQKYNVKIKSGTINPLTNVKLVNDELVKFETYYICSIENYVLEKIKLKQSTIESLFKKENLKNINKFVKSNRLKYNDIDDVIKIIQYYNTL